MKIRFQGTLIFYVGILLTLALITTVSQVGAQCSSGCTTTISSSAVTTITSSTNGEVICLTVTPSANMNVNLNHDNVTIRVCAPNVTFNSLNISKTNFTVESWGINTIVSGANVNTSTFTFITHSTGAQLSSGAFNNDISLQAKSGGDMTIGSSISPGGKVYITVDSNATMNTKGITTNNGGAIAVNYKGTLNVTGSLYVQSTTTLVNSNKVNVTGDLVVQGGTNALSNQCGESQISVGGEFRLDLGTINNAGVIITKDLRFNAGSGPLYMKEGSVLQSTNTLWNVDQSNVLLYNGTAGKCATFKVNTWNTWNQSLTNTSGLYYCSSTLANKPGSATIGCGCSSSVTYCDASLGVKLIALKAQVYDQTVKIYWTVEDEKGVDEFYILKSNGDNNFTKIGSVKSSGQGTYYFTDNQLISSASLYELSIVDEDQDGEGLNSNIVSVTKNNFSFTIFPNPANSNSTLAIDFNSSNKPVSISLINLDGSQVMSYSYTNAFQQINLSSLNLHPGIYLFKAIYSDKSIIQKLFVE